MIVTVTPNPSLDRTIELPGPLIPGELQRAAGQSVESGGKGVNVSRALSAAGAGNLAVLPGDPSDPVLVGLAEIQVPFRSLPLGAPLRTNITITDPQGTTTKINEAGPRFGHQLTAALEELILHAAEGASWVVLAGSLPPGVPDDFYARVAGQLRSRYGTQAPRIAVDASGPALAAAVAARPDLIKPNAEELLDLHRRVAGAPARAGAPQPAPAELERHPDLVVDLLRDLQPAGVRTALVTLGARGALLIPPAGSADPVLCAYGPPLTARSTVGAGDASLAGYLAAHQAGGTAEDCLRQATAQGRAAASLPGSTMPAPGDLTPSDVVVEAFHPDSERHHHEHHHH
ncbi:1-phosphofructokinase family hexose kinase [Sediminivirga luteola]|uniref:1-phosphofructokinase family hexose kinase n=1 Tax=Sediminivirga luteola TaxID=1774748 RepID=UPI001F5864AC|nr:hexose kinase [Sediminivirga luteola]MCI2265665.1 hexose kinase [Sediminivirga luteola]